MFIDTSNVLQQSLAFNTDYTYTEDAICCVILSAGGDTTSHITANAYVNGVLIGCVSHRNSYMVSAPLTITIKAGDILKFTTNNASKSSITGKVFGLK